MREKFLRYIQNGGKKEIAYLSIILYLLIYVVKLSFGSGIYVSQIKTNLQDIQELKEKISVVEEIQRDIAQLKTNQERILEILQGKYGRK